MLMALAFPQRYRYQADTIVQIGALGSASAKTEVDAGRLAIARVLST